MIHDLVAATTRLADSLSRENTALDALDVSGAVSLLPEKRSALAALTEAHSIVLTPAQRPAMAEAVRRLQAVASENRRLLQRALTVQNRVIEVIVSTLPRQEAAGGYGTLAARARAARPTAWSLVARA